MYSLIFHDDTQQPALVSLFVQLYNYTNTGSKSYCGFIGSPNADVYICPPQGAKCYYWLISIFNKGGISWRCCYNGEAAAQLS